jgi:undecaprenyl-diphosphatase
VILAIAIKTPGPLTALDLALGNFFDDTPFWKIRWLDRFMKLMSYLGYEGVVVTAVIGALVIALRRTWGVLILWVTMIGGAILINRLVKGQFETVRSMVGHPDVLEVSTGFPSGHTMMSLVTYGLLAYLVSQQIAARRHRVLLFGATGLLIGLITLARLYLTVHYLSDVLGGAAGGIAWLALCMGLFTWLSAQREPAHGSAWQQPDQGR